MHIVEEFGELRFQRQKMDDLVGEAAKESVGALYALGREGGNDLGKSPKLAESLAFGDSLRTKRDVDLTSAGVKEVLCEFINSVEPEHERVGVDLNADSRTFAAPGVTIHVTSAERMAEVLPKDHFDVAFASNFFEHCRTSEVLVEVLEAVHHVLKPGGKLLIRGPKLKYGARTYFDYFDHDLPLTDESMAEALRMTGFGISEQLPQTLPFTMRGRLPAWPPLVSLYLRIPLAWKIFGAQFFIAAVKEPRPSGG